MENNNENMEIFDIIVIIIYYLFSHFLLFLGTFFDCFV